MAETGYTIWILQYWFILLTLGLGLLLIVLFNCIAFLYFSKRKPIDPVKLFNDMNKNVPEDEPESESPIEPSAEPFISPEPSFENDWTMDNYSGPDQYLATEAEPVPVDDQLEERELSQFRIDALAAHNEYRDKHNAQPLQYSEDLSMYAQYWAENMAKTGRLIHSPTDWRIKLNNEPLGENVVLTNGFDLTGKGMSDMWYSESYKHNYQELQKETKSFTQMVWCSTKKVGFGKAKSEDGKWFGCAHYYPEGNIIGLFSENVKPLPKI